MQKGAKHTDAAKARMRASQLAVGARHTDASKAAIGRAQLGNKHSAGWQNARKVTPEKRARIFELVGNGLGSYRIAKQVGVSKKTVINVRKGRH